MTVLCKFSRCSRILSFHLPRYKGVKRKVSNAATLVYKENGNPSNVVRYEDREIGSPKSNEVKVDMLMAPINPADINTIQGVYPVKPSFPAIGGFEGVGKISELGSDVSRLKIGDLVIPAMNSLGTWRTHLVCDANDVSVVPKGTPELFAATLRVNMCTAYRMLKDFEDLQEGDVVIQNAANSGAGQAVIQIAAARNIRTINIIRDRPNYEEVKRYLHRLGGSIVTTDSELRTNASAMFQHMAKPKLALNAVSGKSVISLVRNLQPGGSLITYGGMSKQPLMIPAGSLIFDDIKVKGYWMTRWHDNNTPSKESQTMIRELCKWAKEKQVKPPRHRFHPINDYKIALERAMSEQITEKQIFKFVDS